MQKLEKILLNPIVLGVLSLLLFAGGFWGGLKVIGFGKPIYYKEADTQVAIRKRLQTELEKIRRIALEFDNHSQELKKKSKKLEEDEAYFNKVKTDFEIEKKALESVRDEIENKRKLLDARLVLLDANQEPSTAQLSKLYTAMTPENAAILMKAMPESQVVQIIRKMKEANGAKILEQWATSDPQKAARITLLIKSTIPNPEEGAK